MSTVSQVNYVMEIEVQLEERAKQKEKKSGLGNRRNSSKRSLLSVVNCFIIIIKTSYKTAVNDKER